MDDLTQSYSPAAAGDDYQHALAKGFLPIRDVARLTAVHAVTLCKQLLPLLEALELRWRGQFDWPVPLAELALAIEHIQPKALLLYSSQAPNSAYWPRLQAGYACPCLVIGPAAHIHHRQLQALARQNSALGMAPDPLSALHILSARNLLDSQ